MGSFHQQRSNKMMGTSRFVVVALAAVLASGGAFAAVGGTEGVKQIFVTLRMIGPDGEVQQELIIEKIGVTDEPTVLDLDLGDGQTATMKINSINVDEEGNVLDGAVADTLQAMLTVDNSLSNEQFITAELSTIGGGDTTIEILVGDEDAEFGQDISTQNLTLTGMEGEKVDAVFGSFSASTTSLASAMDAAMRRLGNFPNDVEKFDLAAADIIHSWVDDDGVAFDLVMYGVPADDGDGSVYIFKAYEGDDGQRVYDSIGQMTGVDPALLEVSEVQMDGAKITLDFDHDGQAMKMIVNAGGDDRSSGQKSLRIESQRSR